MTKHTSRDEVWNEALRRALLEESFKIEHIQRYTDDKMSNRTIRDTLNTMVELGWLTKDSPKAHRWRPGPKVRDSKKIEENFKEKSEAKTPEIEYTKIDQVKNWHLDRVSGSANLVVEKTNSGHVLGSHGPLGEPVKIPHYDGDPLRISLPRFHQTPRVLVCRPEEVIQENETIEGITRPKLHTEDIVPVYAPTVVNQGTEQESIPEESNKIPLFLFSNVKELRVASSTELDAGSRYAIKINSINDNVAEGDVYDKASINSGNSSSENTDSEKTLENIAKEAGVVTTSSEDSAVGRIKTGWRERRKKVLTDISNTYD